MAAPDVSEPSRISAQGLEEQAHRAVRYAEAVDGIGAAIGAGRARGDGRASLRARRAGDRAAPAPGTGLVGDSGRTVRSRSSAVPRSARSLGPLDDGDALGDRAHAWPTRPHRRRQCMGGPGTRSRSQPPTRATATPLGPINPGALRQEMNSYEVDTSRPRQLISMPGAPASPRTAGRSRGSRTRHPAPQPSTLSRRQRQG